MHQETLHIPGHMLDGHLPNALAVLRHQFSNQPVRCSVGGRLVVGAPNLAPTRLQRVHVLDEARMPECLRRMVDIGSMNNNDYE